MDDMNIMESQDGHLGIDVIWLASIVEVEFEGLHIPLILIKKFSNHGENTSILIWVGSSTKEENFHASIQKKGTKFIAHSIKYCLWTIEPLLHKAFQIVVT